MKLVSYLFFRIFIGLFTIVPFWLLYRFSDLLYYLVYYIFNYRKKVTRKNLTGSFPDKNAGELLRIEKKFYSYFCDLLLESMKGMTMSSKQIIKRHKMLNPEFADIYFKNNQSLIVLTAHYGNWEWGSFSGSLQIDYPVYAFYKPLNNLFIDNYIRKRRAKFNTTLLSIMRTFDSFAEHKNKTVAYIMVADQNTSTLSEAYWINFLNRETACLHGPEKYARLYNYPVLYIDIQRKKRGFYELTLSELVHDPSLVPSGKITEVYFKKLEEIINKKPEFWLWTHKRWKYTKNDI